MNVSHDHFGNLRRTSRIITEKYGKINTKRKSKLKIDRICEFSCNFEILAVVSVRYFLILCVHVKIIQNNQQLKELQAAYENRKRFTINLNGTYAKL